MSARTCYHSQFIHIWRWASLFIFSAFCRIEANFIGRKKGFKGREWLRMHCSPQPTTMERLWAFSKRSCETMTSIFHRFLMRDYFARQRKCIKILSTIVSFQLLGTKAINEKRLSNKTSENSTSNKRVIVVWKMTFFYDLKYDVRIQCKHRQLPSALFLAWMNNLSIKFARTVSAHEIMEATRFTLILCFYFFSNQR